MANLRDAAIVVAAGVTVVGTMLWLKESEETRQLAAVMSDEQQKMRAALEHLATTLERIETQMQTLSAAQPGGAVSLPASAKKTATPAKRVTAALNGTEPTPSARRRPASSTRASRSRNANGRGAEQTAASTASDEASKEAG